MKHLRDTLNVILPFIMVGVLIFVIFSLKAENYPEEGMVWENKNCPFHPNGSCKPYNHPQSGLLFPEREPEWNAHKPMRSKVTRVLTDPDFVEYFGETVR